MIFEVEHHTSYAYDAPVALGPHALRLRPREDGGQHLLRFDLDILPRPMGLTDVFDVEGNRIANAWFEGRTRSFDIRASFTAETLRRNPFDFVLDPQELARVPLAYPPDMQERLAPYRVPPGSPAVQTFARDVAAEAGGETVAFLVGLARRVRRDVRGVVRRDGLPMEPEAALAKGEGACRDQAVLWVEACRAMGLAARFVSGYHEVGPGQPERELHAWGEAYLGGAGWRGFDPSMGEAVAQHHVAVAAGRAPFDAAPVQGTFAGGGVQATLRARVTMRTRAGEPSVSPRGATQQQ